MNDPVIPPVEVPPADPVIVPPVVPPVVVPPVVPPVEVAPVVVPPVVPPVIVPDTPDYKALYEASQAEIAKAGEGAAKTTAIAQAIAIPAVRAVDGNAVAALIDQSKLTINNGRVEGVDAEIARLKTAYPGLFNAVGGADGAAVSTGVDTATSPFSRLSSAYANSQTK